MSPNDDEYQYFVLILVQ